jgi:hypothetical protein
VADKQVVVEEPHVGFNASAAPSQGIIEGHLAPVVVVRVAWDRGDVSGDVEEVVCQVGLGRVRIRPLTGEGIVDDRVEIAECDVDNVYHAAGEC